MGYIGGHGVQFSKKKTERDLAENERDLAELDKHLAVVLRAWSVPRDPASILDRSWSPPASPGPFLDPSWTVPGAVPVRFLDVSWTIPPLQAPRRHLQCVASDLLLLLRQHRREARLALPLLRTAPAARSKGNLVCGAPATVLTVLTES